MTFFPFSIPVICFYNCNIAMTNFLYIFGSLGKLELIGRSKDSRLDLYHTSLLSSALTPENNIDSFTIHKNIGAHYWL